MRVFKTTALGLFGALSLLTASTHAETCYSYRGFEVEDQQICEGSGACCGMNDECRPNKLCKSRGSADNVLVRGSCSSKSWGKGDDCAEICTFNEQSQNTGLRDGIFPRVEICDEGVYCCRLGTQSCCGRENRLVYLDEKGARQSGPPSSTTTETSSAKTSQASTTLSNSNPDPTQTDDKGDDEDNAGDDALGLKIGLGVGIPLAISITAFGTWWFLRKRQEGRVEPAEECGTPNLHLSSYYANSLVQQHKDGPQYYVADNQMAQPHELETWSRSPPQEMMGSEVPAHLRQR